MASTWAANAYRGRPKASGPSQPIAGIRRRNERGPITQRAAWWVIAPMPRSVAAAPQLASNSRRHGWLRHDVQVNVSERTRSGYRRATSWLIAPPIDAPTTCAASTPTASRTAMASSAICSRLYAPCGLSLRPAPRLSRAIVRCVHASAMRCRSQACLSAPRPWINSTGGPPGRPVTA